MAKTITLKADESGTNVSLEVGDFLAFELEENPTTGYRWQVGGTGPVLALDGDDFSPGGGRIGAGGTRRLRFAASGPGDATIALSLARQWIPDQAMKVVTVHVKVSR